MRKKAEGKVPRKKNLKVIHTAEPERKNLAPTAKTLVIVWKMSPSQAYLERRMREGTFL